MRGTFYSDGALTRFYEEGGVCWVRLCNKADDTFELASIRISERQCALFLDYKKLGTFNNVKLK